MLSLSAAHLEASYRCVGSNSTSDVQCQNFKSSNGVPFAPSQTTSLAGTQLLPTCYSGEPPSTWTQRLTGRRPAADVVKSPGSEERRAKAPLKAETPSDTARECPPMNGLDRVAMTGPSVTTTASPSGPDHLNWLAEAAARGQVPQVNPTLASPKSTLHSSSGSLFRPPGETPYQFSSGSTVPTTLPLFYGQQGRSGYGGFYVPSQYSPPGRGYTHQPAPTSPGLIPPQQFFRLDQTFPATLDSLSPPQISHGGRSRFLSVQQSQQPHTFESALSQAKGTRTHYEAFDTKAWGELEKMTYAESPKKSNSEDCGELKNYKIACTRDGTIKHRILRPPNITIVEPPASALGRAPLSAPPLRNSSPYQEIPSPKYMKLTTTSSRPCVPGSVPSASSGSSSLQRIHHQHQYPAHFKKGSIIQLANNTLRRVEDLKTEDFLQSAQLSPDLRIDTSVVVRIIENPDNKSAVLGFSVGKNQVQVSVDTPLEHPFFVFNRGWSSCYPQRSLELYGLTCDKLQIGDICISLTHKSSGPANIPLTLAPPAKKTSSSCSTSSSTAPAVAPATSSEALEGREQSHKLLPVAPVTNTTVSSPPLQKRKRRCSAPAVVSLDVSPTSGARGD